jgi:hypothetical protein
LHNGRKEASKNNGERDRHADSHFFSPSILARKSSI